MKLNKVNKNGSLSIILPKDIVKLNNWKEGQQVEIIAATKNGLVIRQEISLQECENRNNIYDTLNELQTTIKSFLSMNKPDDVILRDFLKQQLLLTIEKL